MIISFLGEAPKNWSFSLWSLRLCERLVLVLNLGPPVIRICLRPWKFKALFRYLDFGFKFRAKHANKLSLCLCTLCVLCERLIFLFAEGHLYLLLSVCVCVGRWPILPVSAFSLNSYRFPSQGLNRSVMVYPHVIRFSVYFDCNPRLQSAFLYNREYNLTPVPAVFGQLLWVGTIFPPREDRQVQVNADGVRLFGFNYSGSPFWIRDSDCCHVGFGFKVDFGCQHFLCTDFQGLVFLSVSSAALRETFFFK